jgi:acetyl-CoA carboxylase biotin carboxyl carrier protein
MNVELLQQLVKLMAANDLNTVDVRDGQKRIILKRGAVVPTMTYSQATAAPAGQGSAPSAPAAPTAAPSEDANLKSIKSPMVGTYYSKPSPDSKPFVGVGSVVDEDTDVCVIEAMKVFNNIKAECRGTIAKVLIQDGQPVEYGTVLFLVRPS